MLSQENVQWLCTQIGIEQKDILSISPNPNAGMNNRTCIVSTRAGQYLLRLAGDRTDLFTPRMLEAHAYAALHGLGITDECLAYDVERGWKLTRYISDARTCNPHNAEDQARAMALLRRLHGAKVRLLGVDQPLERMERYAKIAKDAGSDMPSSGVYRRLADAVYAQAMCFALSEEELCPVHADALAGNVLFCPDGRALLIDLEFASMGSFYGDLADFCHDANLSKSECVDLLERYLLKQSSAEERDALFAYCAVVALMWSGWAAFKEEAEPQKRAFFRKYRDMSLAFANRMME